MRVLQGRDLVICGYTPVGRNLDAILVDYYEGRALMFVGKVRAGFTPALRVGIPLQSHQTSPSSPFQSIRHAFKVISTGAIIISRCWNARNASMGERGGPGGSASTKEMARPCQCIFNMLTR
jgi:hypothetical protein